MHLQEAVRVVWMDGAHLVQQNREVGLPRILCETVDHFKGVTVDGWRHLPVRHSSAAYPPGTVVESPRQRSHYDLVPPAQQIYCQLVTHLRLASTPARRH